MRKRILRILGALLGLILVLLVALPFFLEDKLAEVIKTKVNQNINATFDFEQAEISLIKDFPNAYVDLQGVRLVNHAPFAGDTLFAADDIALELSFGQLFKAADDPIQIKEFVVNRPYLNIVVDSLERANYDIAKTGSEEETSSEENTSGFQLDVKHYELQQARLRYGDQGTGMVLEIDDMVHIGNGDLALDRSTLSTHTEAMVSFVMDSVTYLNAQAVTLDADIGIDLLQSKYSFKENKALINQLPLVFDGYVQLLETGQDIQLSFETPTSDFKNFLAVLPETYSKDLAEVRTSGKFEVAGTVSGISDETRVPHFDINLIADNASFKYPDLPKAVTDVALVAKIANSTGLLEDTFVKVDRLGFRIDEDVFKLKASIQKLLGNPLVGFEADGRIDLAKISQAYPLPDSYDLTGQLQADIRSSFDMAALDEQAYERTSTQGEVQLQDFRYRSEALTHPVMIDKAALSFTPTVVRLNNFEGRTGASDFKAFGTVSNMLGYLFNKEDLQGEFTLSSNQFTVDDFMVDDSSPETAEASAEPGSRVKLPAFLDCTIEASATRVTYDDLTLDNVQGRLRIKDETATLENVSSSIFGGQLGLNGNVATKAETGTFDMALKFDAVEIAESFKSLKLFKALAPIANALQGRMNTEIRLSGNLNDDLTPNLASLTGDVLAQLLATKVSSQNTPLLASLDQNLSFVDLEKWNLKDLKAALEFEDSKVKVKPLALAYEELTFTLDGSHTFANELAYRVKVDVPVEYLGNEVQGLIAQIDDDDLEGLTIPVTATIGGNYSDPKVQSDFTSGVGELTKQLVEIQKRKLVAQGSDAVKDLLGDVLGNASDSTKTDSTTNSGNAVGKVLGGLLGEGKSDSIPKDSTQGNEVKDAAKSILGGLLGKKKKKKDSVD
ncbi:AsmA-like C-terminal region-containing protein [Flagellimonas sp. DF-77]|uniref:AsmA family protein n=1 Tax=Flagellimonas algarum TaxID=3230298 RepID=UPI003399D23B